MDRRNGLDRYEILVIGIIILGFVIYFSGSALNSYSYHKLHDSADQFSIDEYSRLTRIGNGQILLGVFIYGIGFFLAFKRLNGIFKIHKHFNAINYSYLIFLFPTLIQSIYFYPFMEGDIGFEFFPPWGIVYRLLTSIKTVLFFTMILLIFIKIYRKYEPTLNILEEYQKKKKDHEQT